MTAEEPPYDRGGLPGVLEGAEQVIGPLQEPVVTEADRKRLMEAFHGFGEGSGPPPALDLAGDIADRLRIREEAPCVAAPLGPLPRREKSPECAECGHPKDGHRDSLGMRRGCWNCLECKGFVPKEVR